MNVKEIARRIIKKYNDSLVVITITAIYNKINMLCGKYVLQKDSALDKVIVLDAPSLVGRKNEFRDEPIVSDHRISDFVNKMEVSVSKENLLAMYRNLHTLNIKNSDFRLMLTSIIMRISMRVNKGVVGGGYIPTQNKVITYSPRGEILTKKLLNVEGELISDEMYTHELLHMSSSSVKKNKICCGFDHRYLAPYAKFRVGAAINEGYTELLNESIFGAKDNHGIYEVYKIVSQLVENIIGKEKMMDLYFSANLKGLISELSSSIGQKETKKFILDLDLINKETNKINEVVLYLFNLYSAKINNELKNGKITNEEAVIFYDDFKSQIFKLNEVFNEFLKAKKRKNNEETNNVDIISVLEEQQPNVSRYRRGNINISLIMLALNFYLCLLCLYTFYICD